MILIRMIFRSFIPRKGREISLLVSASLLLEKVHVFTVCGEELSLKKNIIVSHIVSSKHKTGKEKLHVHVAKKRLKRVKYLK